MKFLFGHCRFRIALTATPLENTLEDLFSIFEWVDKRVFISKEYFNKRYIVWRMRSFRVRTRRGGEVTVRKMEPVRFQNLQEVKVKIRPSYLRRLTSEVGQQLPDLVVKWDVVELGPSQRKVYEACRKDALIKLKNLRGSATLAPLQALRQACNSTALVMKGINGKPLQVKVDRLKQLLRGDLSNDRVIVFTDYARFVELLMHELKEFKPVSYTGQMNKNARESAMANFKSGASRLLLMTKAGERGHNLQMGSVIVNIDMPFNPAALKQRIGRIRRLKSEHAVVRVINMIAADTIEETLILRRIYGKRALFEAVFEEDELTAADPLSKMDVSKFI